MTGSRGQVLFESSKAMRHSILYLWSRNNMPRLLVFVSVFFFGAPALEAAQNEQIQASSPKEALAARLNTSEKEGISFPPSVNAIDFCFFKNELYTKGSVVKMEGYKKECREGRYTDKRLVWYTLQ